MSTSTDSGNNGTGTAQSPEEIRSEIERTRADLADTVDALHAKMDVKARARAKMQDVKHRATTSSGNPRPEVLAAVAGAILLTAAVVWWRRR